MKKKLPRISILIITILLSYNLYSQTNLPIQISNNQQNFVDDLIRTQKSKSSKLKIDSDQSFDFSTTTIKKKNNVITLIGGVNNAKRSTFSITQVDNTLDGRVVLYDSKKAYKLYSNETGKVFIREVDINTLVCTDIEKVSFDEKEKFSTNSNASRTTLTLESLPGATGVIYIDFDGELVTNTSWVNSGTIDAKSPNFSDAKITEIWKIMAEDFRPFNLNVTTRRDVYDAAPTNRKIMCIFTTTKDAAPTSGGVAYLNSFSWNNSKEPCWVYNLSTRAAGETGSHEVGHALGLGHDGRPDETYYSGHGQWSPIMGWSANKTLGHWSMGEYPNANNPQDDLAIISNNRNGVGYQNDDHGDTTNEATSIKVTNAGVVNPDQNFGLITTRNDKDLFSFVIETGPVSFSFNPDPDYPNLNIQARILNELGQEVALSNPNGLTASINENLTEGTYYIEIDGVGEGNLTTGYSDYSSIGNYTISGNYTPGDNLMPPLSEFSATQNCLSVEFENKSTNIVTSYLWDFGDGTTSTEENPTHTYSTNGEYSVSLTTTNNSGNNKKEKEDFIIIAIPNEPVATDQVICKGESSTLTATGNSDFNWYETSTGGTSIASGAIFQTPTLTANKTYYIQGTINGCITEARTAVKVIVSEVPGLPLTANQNLCTGESTTLVAAGNSNYKWYTTSSGGSSIATGSSFQTPMLNTTTSYYVEGLEGNCTSESRIEVKAIVFEKPEQPTIEITNNTTLSISSNYNSYQWYLNNTPIDGADKKEYTVTEEGEYTIEVFNESGCSIHSESFKIDQSILTPTTPIDDDNAKHTYYPNPLNNDELLYINGLTQEDQSIRIVNLRGQTILKTTPKSQTKINVSKLPKGLYVILVNDTPLGKIMKE